MDENKIQKIQDELLANLDAETKTENDIKDLSDIITGHLMVSKRCKADINNKDYDFAYRLIPAMHGKPSILYMVVADVIKQQIAGNKYTPFTVNAHMDQRYAERDNLKTLIESFIRHITGRVKPETLED